MNCLEFRRIITADPADQHPGLLRHMRDCQACAAFARRQSGFEHILTDAMRIKIPEGLASRILLRQSMGVQRHDRLKRYRWHALAASLVLTLGIVGGMLTFNYPRPLDAVVLNHIEHEIKHLYATNNVGADKLNTLFKPFNMQFKQTMGQVNFARICPMRHYAGAHLIVQGEVGPVTVLLMPGEYVQARSAVQDGRFKGVIVPLSKGSMAIVGEDGEAIDKIEQRLQASVNFIS